METMKVTVEMSTIEREKRARNWARLLEIQKIKIQNNSIEHRKVLTKEYKCKTVNCI